MISPFFKLDKTGTLTPRIIPEPTEAGLVSSFDDTKIYWELHGPHPDECDRAPLVFCYGLVCSMNQWRKQIEHFSPHRSCLLLDYRGHQRSAYPRDEKKMNISALARDVLSVIDSFHLKQPVHLWGHSMGCNVALEAALADPEKFRSLVLCCGTLDNPFEKMFRRPWMKEIFMRVLSFYENYPELYVRAWKKILMVPELTKVIATYSGFNPLASNEEDTEAYTLSITKVNPKTFFPLITELTKGMSHAIAPKVQTPALIVAGGYDKVTPPESQKKFSSELPNAKYIEIPAGSHNVQLDFGEYVAMKAEEFWKELYNTKK